MTELHKCPCDPAGECLMDEPCLGCEEYAKWEQQFEKEICDACGNDKDGHLNIFGVLLCVGIKGRRTFKPKKPESPRAMQTRMNQLEQYIKECEDMGLLFDPAKTEDLNQLKIDEYWNGEPVQDETVTKEFEREFYGIR